MSAFHASAEQHELIDGFGRPLEELFPVARLHDAAKSDAAHWRKAAEFGWFGVSLAESAGGIGLSVVEEALLFAQFGRHLISPGFMAAALATRILARTGDTALGARILAGDVVVAMARRDARRAGILLLDAGQAELCLILTPDGAEIFAMDSLIRRKTLDPSQWSFALEAAVPGGAPVAQQDIAMHAYLLIAAQLTGIAAAALDMAVSYSLLRQQFGAPIGSFQAVKHHCANMAMQAQAARDMLSFAAVAGAEDRADAGFQIAAALNVAIRAALFNARTNIQIHGGMGFSAECDAHLFLKRAHVLKTLAGEPRGIELAQGF